MLIAIAILSLSALACAENQTDQYYPNCDLVSVSYVDIHKNENGTVDIDFSWDRKQESYDKINGSVTQYVVRHGPLVNEQPTNQSQIMRVAPDQDSLTLRNVTPCEKYFIQICAVSKSYRFLFQNDLWDHAWRGWMGLSPWMDKEPVSGTAAPPEPTEPASEAPQSFSPQCDLVQTSYVSIGAVDATRTLTVRFSWDKKESSYKTLGAFDHYLVRHGPVNGGVINASQARYMPVDNDTRSFLLTDIQPGSIYGLQICAVSDDDFGIEPFRDWNRTAWLGTMDLSGSLEEFGVWAPEYSDGDIDVVSEDKSGVDTSGTAAPEPEPRPKSFVPKCDLVKMGAANVIPKDDGTVAVAFRWTKKQSSYDQVGFFDNYMVRYGPWRMGEGIIADHDRYYRQGKGHEDGDAAEEVVLLGIQPGGEFGIQICAVLNTEDDMTIDWSQAWTGAMTMASYEAYDESHMTSRAVEVTKDSTPVFIPPRQPVTPMCDLVEFANVTTTEIDPESKTLTVEFSWDKKVSSYSKTGYIDHYLVRHGPVGIMDEVKETEARYLVTDSNSTQFTVLGVPMSGQYGVSICAIPFDDKGINFGIDWGNQARPVMLEFDMKDPDVDGVDSGPAVPPPGQQDSNENTDPENVIDRLVQQSPVMVTEVQMGTNYGVVLVVLAVVSIITTIVACMWLYLTKKRRNAEKAGLIEP